MGLAFGLLIFRLTFVYQHYAKTALINLQELYTAIFTILNLHPEIFSHKTLKPLLTCQKINLM